MNIIIFLFVLLILYIIFKPEKEKTFEIIFPNDVSQKEKSRLLTELGKKVYPPYDRNTNAHQYFKKLVPYLAIRCRMLGFPKGSKIILRAFNQEYTSII